MNLKLQSSIPEPANLKPMTYYPNLKYISLNPTSLTLNPKIINFPYELYALDTY